MRDKQTDELKKTVTDKKTLAETERVVMVIRSHWAVIENDY